MGVGTGPAGCGSGGSCSPTLPETNRLRRHHEQRWALDTASDANFADMYLHPQETSYDLERLFRLVDQPGLRFAGFSNPEVWDPARLLKGELLERARALPPRQQWALVESLDPDISHFEFFLQREGGSDEAAPPQEPWSDAELLAAGGERNRCLWGWPSTHLLGPDLAPLTITEEDLALMQALEAAPAGTPTGGLPLALEPTERVAAVRRLLAERALLLLRA